MRTIRLVGSGAIGTGLLIAAPWVGWWTANPRPPGFAEVLGPERVSDDPHYDAADRRRRCPHGQPAEPGPRLAHLPAAMAAARFRPQVVIAGSSSRSLHPGRERSALTPATVHDPVPVRAHVDSTRSFGPPTWSVYEAKRAGRNRAVCASDTSTPRSVGRPHSRRGAGLRSHGASGAHALGCPVALFGWVFGYKPNTQPNTCCPLAPAVWGSASSPRKGVPASPLRSKPGTPFLDPTHHRCSGRGQMQSRERERAGSSKQRVERNYRSGQRKEDEQVGRWRVVGGMEQPGW